MNKALERGQSQLDAIEAGSIEIVAVTMAATTATESAIPSTTARVENARQVDLTAQADDAHITRHARFSLVPYEQPVPMPTLPDPGSVDNGTAADNSNDSITHTFVDEAPSAAFSRLAVLTSVEYDRIRKIEAKALEIRPATLDAEVKKARAVIIQINDDFSHVAGGSSDDAAYDESHDDSVDDGYNEGAAPGADTQGIPHGFFVTRKGVFHQQKMPGKDGKIPMLRICSELRVTALVRDRASENWGRVLEFKDADTVPHQWALPMDMLAGDGTDMRKELSQLGLEIAPGYAARNLLTEYITGCKPKARARCVQKTGWYDEVFVFPDRTIGTSRDRVLFQSEKAARHYAQVGTLQQWQDNVARLCSGNSRLVLGICAAFASPMLHLAGQDSGGVHLVGPSSIGKTTVLHVAASVYGGQTYMQNWRATANGLEGLCALHNDTLLILDEIAQLDPKDAGAVAYMIANGSGKTRSDRHGDARDKKTWRLLFLSSGEIGLAQHMRDGGKSARAGQELRMIDMPADAGAGHGIFENLHDYENGNIFSEAITETAQAYYGTAAIAFIEAMTADLKDLPALLKEAIAEFVTQHLPKDAGGQAARVCKRFAIIACAGEYATSKGITGWDTGEAIHAAETCFKAWLDQRGGAGNQEKASILASVKAFFETHGDARFTDIRAGHDRTTINRAGFRESIGSRQQFYVLPEAYKREVCAGFDQRIVTKVLLDAGWLLPGKDGKSSPKKSLPDMGETRCYVFASAMWEDGYVD